MVKYYIQIQGKRLENEGIEEHLEHLSVLYINAIYKRERVTEEDIQF